MWNTLKILDLISRPLISQATTLSKLRPGYVPDGADMSFQFFDIYSLDYTLPVSILWQISMSDSDRGESNNILTLVRICTNNFINKSVFDFDLSFSPQNK